MTIKPRVWFLMPLLLSIVLISGCTQTGQLISDNLVGTKEGAEKFAVKFSVSMSKNDYYDVYDMLLPQIQARISAYDFFDVVYDDFKDIGLIYDKVVMISDNEAYAYYKFRSGILETSMEPFKLEFFDGEWRLNAFAGVVEEIETKKVKEVTVEKSDYFYNIGELAESAGVSIKINDVRTVDELVNKYGSTKRLTYGDKYLIVDATIKNGEERPFGLLSELGFGNCIYKYDLNNVYGNKYFSTDKCYKKVNAMDVEGSFDSMEDVFLSKNEEISGFAVYQVSTFIEKFVVPYEKFYQSSGEREFEDIFFIVEV
jgi:hypothetical protein